jgi:hypothetical protein
MLTLVICKKHTRLCGCVYTLFFIWANIKNGVNYTQRATPCRDQSDC